MSELSKNQTQDQNRGGFAGTLRNIQLTDIIQMCCLAGASICVRVRQDQLQGALYVQDGDIVHAECGSVTGVEAFFTILGWPSGQFETQDAPLVSVPSIKESCQFLLMEAARRADEGSQETVEVLDKTNLDPVDRLRVMIVDDSAIMTKIVASMLRIDAGIDVVGNAKNGEEALEKMKQLSPDLITMDVNMPVMGGSTALKHIMIESPCPVVIMSNLGPSSYATILSFLNLGAVDFMSKPVRNSNIIKQQQRMVDRIHTAANANIKRFQRLRLPKLTTSDFIATEGSLPAERIVIAISGVGGYLEMVNTVASLPEAPKATVLSMQSIPPQFALALSDYLNARSRFEVQPLLDGAPLLPGRCYIGASGRRLEIETNETGIQILKDTSGDAWQEDDNSLDHLLSCAAEKFGDHVTVLLLSGGELVSMDGLHKIKAAGGRILVPDPDQSILSATLAPVMDQGVITEIFDPKELRAVLKRLCG